MEEELSNVVPCSSLTVDSSLRVGTAGAIWGLCAGPGQARRRGLVAVVFTSTCCGIQRYWRQNDLVNAFIAGAMAGAVVAAGTRRWT